MSGRILAWSMEAVLVLLIIGAPWAFGSVHAPFELWLGYAIGLLVALYGIRSALEGRVRWGHGRATNLVAMSFYLLFLIATLQTFPLVPSFVSFVSPNSAKLLSELEPSAPEQIKGVSQVATEPKAWRVGNRLSLNPGGSHQFSIRLLALTGLFLAVCSLSNVPGLLFRISVAGAVVGSALALFSLVQYFSSSPQQIYWFFQSNGGGFGPFISRNHYPFYANLALGLTTGLLLDRYAKSGRGWFITLTQDTWAMWILAAMIFIMASVIVCVSRGGFVAMVLALLVCLSTRLGQGKNIGTLGLALAIVLAASVLLTWVGFDLFASRLSTLMESEQMREDGRWHLWAAAAGTIARFPLFGSGGETFRYWETMLNQNAQWNSSVQFALRCDNEFLDIWSEYGILGLVALVVMTFALLWQGYRWARRDGLAAGAFMAMTAVIAHSCLDFGLRVPASAVFATIIAGLLCSFHGSHRRRRATGATSRSTRSSAEETPESPKATDNPAATRVGAWAMLAVALIVSCYIINEKRRYADAYYWQSLGQRALKNRDFQQCMTAMNRATEITREDVQSRLTAARAFLLAAGATNDSTQKQALIRAALVHSIYAKQLCPLAFEPHLWLAQHVDELTSGDTRLAYLTRAHRLHPSDADISFALGAVLFDEQRFDQAWSYWQNSLTFSSKFMTSILMRASKHLAADKILQLVLPSDSSKVAEAATVAESLGQLENSHAFLAQALKLMPTNEQDTEKAATNHRLAASLYQRLGQTDEAIGELRLAITYRPGANDWRLDLVQLLIKQELYDHATRELSYVKLYEPENRVAISLGERLEKLKREKKK